MDIEVSILTKKDIVKRLCPRGNMLHCFREGYLALQQHFQGQGDLDAVDGPKAGIAIGTTVGAIWLIGLFFFTLL